MALNAACLDSKLSILGAGKTNPSKGNHTHVCVYMVPWISYLVRFFYDTAVRKIKHINGHIWKSYSPLPPSTYGSLVKGFSVRTGVCPFVYN